MAGNSTKAVLAALLANTGIAIAKMVGWVVTGASSMLAEGVHSFADAGNQALLLLGGRQAKKEATPEHPFGYGRERYFWAFVVSVVLFTLGSAFAIFEGIEKIRHPHEVESIGWAVGILAFGIILEGFSFRTAIVEANPLRNGVSWWRFVRRAKQPELPVVLLEDLGAMLGLVMALVAVSLTQILDDPVWDGIGTLGIGILLGVIAVVLAIEMKSLLIGESASPDDVRDIERAIREADDVENLIHMRTQHIGPDELLVGAKVEFDGGLSHDELAPAIDRVEAAVREAVPSARMIYLEPDVHR